MTGSEPLRVVHGDILLEGAMIRANAGSSKAAVLMIPGATGPGDSFREAARELAGHGYLVIEVDMYGSGADVSSPQAAGEHFSALMRQPELLRKRIIRWFEAVRALPEVPADRIAAIGYCFGGKCVLELVRSGADLAVGVSFHGLLTTHALALPGSVKGRVAIWTGGRDPYAPVSDLDALRYELDAAGANYQVTLFSDAQHSFTDPDHDGYAEGIAYDRVAHRVAWTGTIAMLDASFAE